LKQLPKFFGYPQDHTPSGRPEPFFHITLSRSTESDSPKEQRRASSEILRALRPSGWPPTLSPWVYVKAPFFDAPEPKPWA